jgi:hypothetical protein
MDKKKVIAIVAITALVVIGLGAETKRRKSRLAVEA